MMNAHALAQKWLPVSHFREQLSAAMAGDLTAKEDIVPPSVTHNAGRLQH